MYFCIFPSSLCELECFRLPKMCQKSQLVEDSEDLALVMEKGGRPLCFPQFLIEWGWEEGSLC